MRTSRSNPRRRLGLSAGATSVLLIGTLLAAGPAPAATDCTTPPATFPTAQMTRGMTGVGYTVIDGTKIEPFDVKVLGVMPNGIYLGIDLVVMEMTGSPAFLAKTGGALHGMSGSPIYIGGKLAGALAWGIAEDRRVFGATAAEDMVGLFRSDAPSGVMAAEIALTREIRRAVAAATGATIEETASTMEALPMPLGVSATAGRSLAEIEALFAERGVPVTAFRAGATAPPTTIDPTPLAPGGGFGMGLSYGDVSWYGFGTTTAVCGNTAIAWGHPYWGQGSVSMGLNDVNVIAIDNVMYWGTKIGVLTEAHGTMTEDRFPGVVGVFGSAPELVPISSSFTSVDTGASRNGHSDVAWDEGWFVADVSVSHAWSNITWFAQADAPGTLSLAWTIEGTRQDGSPFTVSNRTMMYSSYSVGEGAWRLGDVLYNLVYNGYEEIAFTGIDMSGDVTQDDLTSEISRIRLASDVQPALRERETLKARPGGTVTVEVTLDPVDGDDVVTTSTFRVPKDARGTHDVVARGGRERYRWGDVGSFDDLVAMLSGGEHPNDLVLSGFGGSIVQEQDVIVSGKTRFWVQIVR